MIYSLRRKFIMVSAVSLVIVFGTILAITAFMSGMQLNNTMDVLTDAIASNNGVFPEFDEDSGPLPSDKFPYTDIITEETQFSTRFLRLGLITIVGSKI